MDLTIQAEIQFPVERREKFQFEGLEQLYHWLLGLRGFRRAYISETLFYMARHGEYGLASRLMLTAEWEQGNNYLAQEIAREVGLRKRSTTKRDLPLALKFAQAYDHAIRTGRKLEGPPWEDS